MDWKVNIWSLFWKPVGNNHPLMVFDFDLNSVVYKIIYRADYLFWITVSNLQTKWKFTVLILKFDMILLFN